jgi:ABC-type Co2+ transport system permease subunit
MAVTLILESITVALALPVVAKLGGGLSGAAGWTVGLLAVLMLAAAFVQRRPWGLAVALVLQAAMIATWPLVPVLGGLGIVFALVWAYLLHLRQDLRRRLTP